MNKISQSHSPRENNGTAVSGNRLAGFGRRSFLLGICCLAIVGGDLVAMAQNAVVARRNALKERGQAAIARTALVQASRLVVPQVNRRGPALKRNLDAYQTRGSELWKELQEKDSTDTRFAEAEKLLMDAGMLHSEAAGKLGELPKLVQDANKRLQNGDREVAAGDANFGRGGFIAAGAHYVQAREHFTKGLKSLTKAADHLTDVAGLLTKVRTKLDAAETIIDRLPAAGAGAPMPMPGAGTGPAPGPGSSPMPGPGMMP